METANYAFELYELENKFTLQDHWMVFKNKICPKCKSPVDINNPKKKRMISFFCGNCQSLFKR